MDNIKILIVEDESIIAMELKDRLNELGYTVLAVVSTGEDAIQEVADNLPDLVLMDIMLRGDMDGIEAAAEIESRFDLPVIYLTANTDPTTIERAKITGPYGYLVKPFEEETFKITIEMALYKYQMEQKLKERESWLNTTLKSIGEGIIATDKNGIVTFMNRVAEELTGWTEQEARGERGSAVFNAKYKMNDENGEKNTGVRFQDGGLPSMSNYSILIAKDGVQIPVEHSTAPIKDDYGKSLGEIIIFQNVSERIRAEEQIRHLATHDTLTNLPNLHLFHDRLAHAITKAKRDKNIVALLYLDLDGFKQVNDNYGHPFGDVMLKLVGIRMSGHVRASDTVARLGGDEFAIVLENVNNAESAGIAAKKILKALSDPITFEGIENAISASIGIAIYPKDGEDNETLLKNADIGMYVAKKSGKNKFQYYFSE